MENNIINQPLDGLLYDLDLLPEQCKSNINTKRLEAIKVLKEHIEDQAEEIENSDIIIKRLKEEVFQKQNETAKIKTDTIKEIKQGIKEIFILYLESAEEEINKFLDSI